MALINCRECGVKISDKAPACVYCGAPLPVAGSPTPSKAPPKKAKPLTWLVLLVVIAVLVFGMFNTLGKDLETVATLSPLPPPKAKTVAPATAAILVSAIQLFKDYKTNAASTDMSYKGEKLLVTGVLDSININNIAGAPYLVISGGGPSQTVHAQFPKSTFDKLSTLKRGQKITVACTGDGMVAGTPTLKGCAISASKLSASPTQWLAPRIEVSATQTAPANR